MVDPLLGLLSFLCRSLLLVSAYGYMTPPVPFPSSLEKLVPNPSGEVVYQKSSVYGVVDRAVILDCGPATLLPDIYIWSFTKPGSQEIKNVVYDLGKGHRMQALARTLGQVTVISNTASLSIEQLALAAHGVFTCQAIYDTATEARFYYYYVYLTVRVPISKPYLEVSESSPVEGNTVRMRCNLENGTGPIQYEWHHENMNGSVTIFGQGNSSVVDVNNINRNNTGWYRCQAQNPVNSEQSDRTWLSIIFGPDVPQIDVTPYTMTERGYSALERETVSLMCQAQSNPPSQYVWLYNNSQVFGGPQYTITKILRMHTGDYTCLAQNTYLNTRSKKSISLTVYFGPDLPQIVATSNTRTESGYTVIEKYAAIEKDNVSLLCQTQSNPPSEYIWIYNNSQISSRPELTISRVLRAQTGDYICLAQNALLNSSSTTNISLSVYYPPEGQPTCSMEAVSNHSSLRLVCLWAGGYPTPKLSWSSDFNLTQQEKTDKQLVKNKAIYVASDNNTLNNSSFTCRGTHPAVTQPAECSVHTYVSDEDLQCFFSVNGLNVTLSCLWEGGVPRALVWWDGPGGHSKPGQEGSNNMTIRYGTLRTEMPYTCHARHPLLTLSKTCNITLVAVSRPSLLLSEASPLEGSSISMICKVQNGTEPIHYEWYYEAENGDAFKIAQSYSSALHLSNLQHNQTGWYRCGANNLVNSQQSDPIWVDVIYSPVNSSHCSMEAVSNHSSLRLVCLWAGGYPPPKLSWSSDLNLTQQEETDTHLVKNTAIFEASDNNTSNNSSFTCRGTHPAVTQPAECSVHTYVPTEDLQCFFSVNGLNVTLSCLWEGGVPRALVWWDGPGGHSKPGQEGSNNMTIRYGTLRTEMPYTCHARHPLLTLSKTCNITLVAVSRPSLLLSEASPLEGSSISMICKVQNGTGPIHYEWYYEAQNGDTFKVAQSYSSALHLSSLQHNQTGWYRCGANNLVNSQQSDPIWVDVIYSPMNSSHCFMEAVSNHSSLRMVCLWAGGYPTPKLSWSSDLNLTQQEETETHLVKNMAIFVASDNNTSNNSSFTCRGTHPAVTQPAECSVHIYVPHEELQCFFSVNGLNVTLSCLWEGGVPRALVWWDGPGGHSKLGQEGSNNMTIRYGTLRTEMPYTCHARHPLLTLSKTCNITMVAVSRPSLLLSEASPLEGSSISMICKVQNGTEPIHYEWYYEAENGDAFKIAQSYSSALHLSNLQHNQTGWYRCGANNLVNSQQSDPIWVDVIYSPMNSSHCFMEAVSNHSSVRLVCLWAGGYPPPKLSWSSDLNLTQQEETGTHLVKNMAIFEASDNNTSNNSSFTCRGTHPAVTQPVECSVHTYVPTEKLQCFFNVNGLNVTLSCLWEGGVPKALVWWDGPGGHSKSGQEGSNNMTIRYGTLRTEMPYTCHARHPLLSQSKTCKITMAPLSKPNLVMSNAYPLEGSTVSMHCSVQSGTEPIQFMWHYHAVSGNTSKFAQNTSVVKLTVKRSDMGLYRCLVQNPVNNIQSDWTLLNVTYGPEFPEISLTPNTVEERGYIALEQETVSLLCQAKSNPPSQYIWFYNNSQVNSGPQFTLKDILRTQTGDYTCLAQNSFLNTRSKKSVSLTVYYPPDGLPTCSVEGTLEHTSLKLLCIWPGGFPSPKLIWSGELVDQEGVNPNTNTATLLYTQGTASNNSLFKCQGSHMALKQPAECSVQPYSPAGEPQCSAYVTSNNQNLMLSCSWDGGFPKALVWWEGPGVQGKGGQEASNILILRYGTVRNEQPYVCYARHPLVAKTKTCTVPLEPPVLQTQRRTVTVFEGTDVQLTCSLMDNNLPSNEITWFNNRGVGVMDTSKYLLLRSSAWANLTVRDTDEIQDSGQYRCTTSNAVGGTEINVTLVVKRHPMPPNASLVSVVYNSPQRNQVDLEWQVHNEEEYKGGWTGFILEYSWMFEKPGRRGGKNESIIVLHPEKIASIWYSSIIQDPDQRTHTLGSLTPTITYQFRITSINHRTLGHPSAPKSPAEPRQNSLPAIIGAAIGGMLFAAILTALLLMYIIRNRNNNPRLHDLLFGRQHSQSRENINFPEDEVMGSAGGIEDIGGLSSSGPTMALPRAASPLTVPSQSATPSTGQPPSDPAFDDGNEPVNVTITVKAT